MFGFRSRARRGSSVYQTPFSTDLAGERTDSANSSACLSRRPECRAGILDQLLTPAEVAMVIRLSDASDRRPNLPPGPLQWLSGSRGAGVAGSQEIRLTGCWAPVSA